MILYPLFASSWTFNKEQMRRLKARTHSLMIESKGHIAEPLPSRRLIPCFCRTSCQRSCQPVSGCLHVEMPAPCYAWPEAETLLKLTTTIFVWYGRPSLSLSGNCLGNTSPETVIQLVIGCQRTSLSGLRILNGLAAVRRARLRVQRISACSTCSHAGQKCSWCSGRSNST